MSRTLLAILCVGILLIFANRFAFLSQANASRPLTHNLQPQAPRPIPPKYAAPHPASVATHLPTKIDKQKNAPPPQKSTPTDSVVIKKQNEASAAEPHTQKDEPSPPKEPTAQIVDPQSDDNILEEAPSDKPSPDQSPNDSAPPPTTASTSPESNPPAAPTIDDEVEKKSVPPQQATNPSASPDGTISTPPKNDEPIPNEEKTTLDEPPPQVLVKEENAGAPPVEQAKITEAEPTESSDAPPSPPDAQDAKKSNVAPIDEDSKIADSSSTDQKISDSPTTDPATTDSDTVILAPPLDDDITKDDELVPVQEINQEDLIADLAKSAAAELEGDSPPEQTSANSEPPIALAIKNKPTDDYPTKNIESSPPPPPPTPEKEIGSSSSAQKADPPLTPPDEPPPTTKDTTKAAPAEPENLGEPTLNLFTKLEQNFKVEISTVDDRISYAVGEPIPLQIRSDRDCYIHIYWQGEDGSRIQIFPNAPKGKPQDNFIFAEDTVPMADRNLDISAADPPGIDTLYVVAGSTPEIPPPNTSAKEFERILRLQEKKEGAPSFANYFSEEHSHAHSYIRIRITPKAAPNPPPAP